MVRKQALVRTALGIALAIGIASASRAEDAAPVRIGVLTDMSGMYRDIMGPGSLLAAQMAVKDFGGKVAGKPIEIGGSRGRKEATGRGLLFVCNEACKKFGFRINDTRVVIQGAGNVGGTAALLMHREGYKVIGFADITGSLFNPSGLDAPGHVMSAHDIAHVAAYLDKYYPQLAAIAAAKDVAIPATATHKAFYPHNLNRLVGTYPGATGLKTGLTENAGGCMLATATRDGRHLVAVVLNATLHSTDDATILLNYGFSVRTNGAFGSLSRQPAA